MKLQTLEMKELSTCGQHQESSFPGPPVSHPNSGSDKDQHEQWTHSTEQTKENIYTQAISA